MYMREVSFKCTLWLDTKKYHWANVIVVNYVSIYNHWANVIVFYYVSAYDHYINLMRNARTSKTKHRYDWCIKFKNTVYNIVQFKLSFYLKITQYQGRSIGSWATFRQKYVKKCWYNLIRSFVDFHSKILTCI